MTPIYLETQGAPPRGRRRRIDFRRLGPGEVLAVVGTNGQGKSQVAFALAGALYGKIEGYPGGSHVKDCLAPGAETLLFQLWFRAGDGLLYRIRRQVDARAHTVYLDRLVSPEAPTFDESGPVVDVPGAVYEALPRGASGLVGDIPDELRRIGVLPYDLWMAAGHAHQTGLGDFFSIEGTDAVTRRRQILAEMLGARETQRLSEEASAQRKIAQRIADQAAREMETLRATVETGRELSAERGRIAERLVEVDLRVTELGAALAGLRGEAGKLREARRDQGLRHLEAEHRGAVEEAARAEGRIGEIVPRLATLRRLKGEADVLEERHRRADALTQGCRRLAADYARTAKDRDACVEGLKRLESELESLPIPPDDIDDHRQSLLRERDALKVMSTEAAEELTAELAAIKEDLARVARDRQALAQAQARLTAATRAVEAQERAAGLVRKVPCEGGRLSHVDPQGRGNRDVEVDCGTCQFLTDAREAAQALPAARAAVDAITDEVLALEDSVAAEAGLLECERDADALLVIDRNATLRRGQIDTALARLDVQAGVAARRARLGRDIAAESERLDALQVQLRQIREEGAAKKWELIELGDGRPAEQVAEWLGVQFREAMGANTAIAALESEEAHLRAVLAVAQERANGLRAQAEELRAIIARDNLRLGRLEAEAQDVDLRLRAAQAEQEAARQARSQLDGKLHTVAEAEAALPSLEALHRNAERERADFELIEKGMGIKGVQGLMIDLAGGAFSRRMNALLAVIYDPGDVWDVVFRTLDPAAKGAKREVADLLVKAPWDARHRLPRVSPGQQQPLKIAMRGASIQAIEEEHGAQVPFAVADELENHLDPERRRRYLDTLKAMGLRSWMVITHHDEIISQADHVLRIDDSAPDGCRWER